jgi:hypothetical protein
MQLKSNIVPNIFKKIFGKEKIFMKAHELYGVQL